MVVDDTGAIARILKANLCAHGYDATLVTTGRDAIELIESNKFDVVISDLHMSPVGGVEVLACAQSLLPSAVRILHTAAEAYNNDVQVVVARGASYLQKPARIDRFLALFPKEEI